MKKTVNDNLACNFAELKTPLGNMIAIADPKGILAFDFYESINLKTITKNFTEESRISGTEKWDDNLIQLKKEIEEYFSGVRREFSVILNLTGTDFQLKVWAELMNIPYGHTRSYSQQALALNNIKAIRAVASANGKNKVAIIVPCHRVIGSNGSLTGYAGCLWRKKWLLEFESKFETTKIF